MAAKGTEVVVARIPDCDVHKYDMHQPGVPALYDAKTKRGPWANMCQSCFDREALYTTLGVGKGQRLILKSDG